MFMFVVHNLNLFVVTLQLPSQFPMRMVFQSSQISIVLSTTHSNEKCEWFSTCSYLQSYHPLFINLPFPSSRRSVFLFSLVFTYFFSLGVPRLGPCLCMCLVVNKFMIFKINSITAELGTPYEPPYLNLLTYLFVIRSALQLLVYLTPIFLVSLVQQALFFTPPQKEQALIYPLQGIPGLSWFFLFLIPFL